MKKLLLIFLFLFPVLAWAQMYGGGHFSRVTDSATYVNDAAVAAYHSAGYADIWYSEATELWYVWDGSSYDNWDPTASGSGGVNTFPPNVQTGNYTIDASDTTNVIIMRSTGAQTLTMPTGLKAGSTFTVVQDSTGTTTLSPASGLDYENASGTLTLNQDEPCVIYYKATDKVIIMKSSAEASGDVVGPGSATDDNIATFDGTTGKLIQDGGFTVAQVSKLSNTASALSDGSSITITGIKHTLTTSQATITFTHSFTGDFSNIAVTMSTTSATWTFAAGALVVTEGIASGDNTATISCTSGDKIVISIWNIDGTNYRVVCKNFGQ